MSITSIHDPFVLLMEQHRHALARLAHLPAAAEALGRGAVEPQTLETITDAVRFLNTDVRLHNTLEEEALFPVMERYFPSAGGPTDAMRREHRELWEALEELEALLAPKGSTSPDATAMPRIMERALFIHGLLTRHIQKEDNILYPMAKQVLADGELGEVAATIERILHHRDGSQTCPAAGGA